MNEFKDSYMVFGVRKKELGTAFGWQNKAYDGENLTPMGAAREFFNDTTLPYKYSKCVVVNRSTLHMKIFELKQVIEEVVVETSS